jgi:hypothetical protein
MSVPTPYSSPPSSSPAKSVILRNTVGERRAASAPPVLMEECDEFSYLPKGAQSSLNNRKPCKLPLRTQPTQDDNYISFFEDSELEWNRDERGASR